MGAVVSLSMSTHTPTVHWLAVPLLEVMDWIRATNELLAKRGEK